MAGSTKLRPAPPEFFPSDLPRLATAAPASVSLAWPSGVAWRDRLRAAPLWLGAVLLGAPTLIDVAREAWSDEQGACGPILLALAGWLIARRWPAMRAAAIPGNAAIGGIALTAALAVHVAARLLHQVSIEALALYGVLVAGLYLFAGRPGLARMRFALAYGLLALPPPSLIVGPATQALRRAITISAVTVTNAAGLTVGRQGFVLYVDQYRIAIVDACSGTNSLLSLTAVCFFYIHMRGRRLDWARAALFWLAILAIAVAANFLRVLAIILLTHGFGPEVAQGPLHSSSRSAA
jgi:exosortase